MDQTRFKHGGRIGGSGDAFGHRGAQVSACFGGDAGAGHEHGERPGNYAERSATRFPNRTGVLQIAIRPKGLREVYCTKVSAILLYQSAGKYLISPSGYLHLYFVYRHAGWLSSLFSTGSQSRADINDPKFSLASIPCGTATARVKWGMLNRACEPVCPTTDTKVWSIPSSNCSPLTILTKSELSKARASQNSGGGVNKSWHNKRLDTYLRREKKSPIGS
jgi:hypothetical protein